VLEDLITRAIVVKAGIVGEDERTTAEGRS
jgi:hypothetical protein